MKLVTAIVQDKDTTKLSNAFVKANVRATRLTTSGGFLRSGNTTFLIAIEDERVQAVLDIIQSVSQKRKQYMVPPVSLDAGGAHVGAYPVEVEVGGATVYTQSIESFHQF
ncbi:MULTISPECIES: cyclic-di-AMP receptor [Leuconostoc]|uniref:Protein from nitrogen regulatory protein P-II (GLNB) family, ortholog YAAQ B. subtilis n=2 Tax=Leuconostoc TaxID=1243 RepID=A0AAN2QW93_9LACO|nr:MULTISPECIES: cyclic-di-AMP receptor [Leuconostoc]MBR2276678.1 cyclic-di-AMP receptor [Leuconostoc sp.]MBZ5944036.1 cyclic-di-AMP receptor [Leuconostoc gasicomitatum]MBZ5945693.1 cyclic-di-AMP receptor [Leuconostoc gasicomitatum]MBZ5947492.1 cyclic-di-AMP receptor [Leuconostoc gasicomitatum]MBZ5949143.1 cyclic-di-AMP receptor [Leuconostoc gasicomitatum]